MSGMLKKIDREWLLKDLGLVYNDQVLNAGSSENRMYGDSGVSAYYK